MPLYNIALINPHGKITGVGKATLQMKAKSRERAEHDALLYCRMNYNWGYHLKNSTPPANNVFARQEIDNMRNNLGLEVLKEDIKFADIPASEEV